LHAKRVLLVEDIFLVLVIAVSVTLLILVIVLVPVFEAHRIRLEEVLVLLLLVFCEFLAVILVRLGICILHLLILLALALGSAFLLPIKRLLQLLFLLPLLLDPLRVLPEGERVHTGALLDQDDPVVVVRVHQADTQGRVPVNVLRLQLGATLGKVHSADGGATLRGVVEGRLEPLVLHIDLQALAAAEAADGLDWVDLDGVLPVLDLHEAVMQRRALRLVSQVDVNTTLDEEGLCFKGGISCGTGHVDGMMEKVSSLVINLVDVGSAVQEFLDGRVLSANQSVFEGKEATQVHLVHVGTKVKHLICQLEILLLIEVEEGSASLAIWEINPYIELQEFLEHVLMILIKLVEVLVTHQVEGCHLVVVRKVTVNTKGYDEVEK
jgi:hypothetical protein